MFDNSTKPGEKPVICVLFGGVSSEYEISLLSASSLLDNIDTDKYNVLTVGITHEGKWYLYNGSVDAIRNGCWCSGHDITPCSISSGRGEGLWVFEKDGPSLLHIDVVFPVLHGKNGEDGTIQGLLDIAGLKYVGSSAQSSANCMDKITTKLICCGYEGIPSVGWMGMKAEDYLSDPEAAADKVEASLSYPVFVKPSRAGSSVGITKVNSRAGLTPAILLAREGDGSILFEEGRQVREIETAVFGNAKPSVSVCGEVCPSRDYYTFESKYKDDSSVCVIPADLHTDISESIRAYALKVYELMGCTGLARVDFFIDRESGEVFFNEINTMPGFTDISMYPKLMIYDGMTYTGLIDGLIALAGQ